MESEFSPHASFVGGVRWGSGNASIPLARLEVGDGDLRISLRGILRKIPTSGMFPFEANFEELEPAQAIGSSGFNNGIRFRRRNSVQWVIFWCRHRQQVLTSLEMSGMKVIREPVRAKFWNPGR
jgi:hypothetical protein